MTPNIPEAEVLSGHRIQSMDDAREAARRIHEHGRRRGHHQGRPRATSDGVACDVDRRPAVRRRTTSTNSATPRVDVAAHARHRLHVRVGGRRASRARAARCPTRPPSAQRYVAGAIAHAPGIGHGRGRSITSGGGPTEPLGHLIRPASYTEGAPLLAIGRRRSSSSALPSAVAAEPGGADGAVVTFLGLVRNHNLGPPRPISRIRGVRAAGAARRSSGSRTRSRERWPGARLALHHRIGRLEIGEASVAIAAASPHRGDAFAACRYAIERVKQIAPIWKHEYFDGGDVWIEGATADPDDERRARGSGADRMRVTVRLFARLRDIAGAAELVRESPPGATIGDVWRAAGGEFPELARLRAIDLERGQRRLRADGPRRSRDGDEIAFLPPVSGG